MSVGCPTPFGPRVGLQPHRRYPWYLIGRVGLRHCALTRDRGSVRRETQNAGPVMQTAPSGSSGRSSEQVPLVAGDVEEHGDGPVVLYRGNRTSASAR